MYLESVFRSVDSRAWASNTYHHTYTHIRALTCIYVIHSLSICTCIYTHISVDNLYTVRRRIVWTSGISRASQGNLVYKITVEVHIHTWESTERHDTQWISRGFPIGSSLLIFHIHQFCYFSLSRSLYIFYFFSLSIANYTGKTMYVTELASWRCILYLPHNQLLHLSIYLSLIYIQTHQHTLFDRSRVYKNFFFYFISCFNFPCDLFTISFSLSAMNNPC